MFVSNIAHKTQKSATILGFSIKDGANPLASLAPCKQKKYKVKKNAEKATEEKMWKQVY